ncbi:hypothetical protein VPH35_004108 [Triticum aestivum]
MGRSWHLASVSPVISLALPYCCCCCNMLLAPPFRLDCICPQAIGSISALSSWLDGSFSWDRWSFPALEEKFYYFPTFHVETIVVCLFSSDQSSRALPFHLGQMVVSVLP